MTRIKRWLGRRRLPLGVVALGAAALVPTAITLDPIPSSAASEAASTGASATQLAVFRRPASSADALPAYLRQAAAGWLEPTADLADSRRALVTSAGASIYLVPSEGGVCLIDSRVTLTSCWSAQALAAGAGAASDECSPALGSNTVEIAGVVPDGASDPEVLLNDGAAEPLPVEGNAYAQEYPRSGPLPTQIRWTSPSGGVTVSADVPSGVSSERCETPAEVQAELQSGKRSRSPGPHSGSLGAERSAAG
jgi:hypothetical protein